jgi:urease accessory protein
MALLLHRGPSDTRNIAPMRTRTTTLLGLLVLLATTLPAAAHPGHATGGPSSPGADMAAGFAHPFTGLDHLLAMVAVGLLAAKLGGRATWLLPSLFVAGMVVGGGMAVAVGTDHPIGGVEQGIALSVVVLGVMLAFAGRRPPAWAVAAVPLFALFHGYAHLAEGVGHTVVGYEAGMVAGSAVLHAAGLGVGWAVGRGRAAAWAWRVGGGAVAAVGGALLVLTF